MNGGKGGKGRGDVKERRKEGLWKGVALPLSPPHCSSPSTAPHPSSIGSEAMAAP